MQCHWYFKAARRFYIICSTDFNEYDMFISDFGLSTLKDKKMPISKDFLLASKSAKIQEIL